MASKNAQQRAAWPMYEVNIEGRVHRGRHRGIRAAIYAAITEDAHARGFGAQLSQRWEPSHLDGELSDLVVHVRRVDDCDPEYARRVAENEARQRASTEMREASSVISLVFGDTREVVELP